MRDFNRGSDRGGFNKFGGNRSGGGFRGGSRGGDRSDREMFDAICDECGRNCKLPFQPSSNKPVFCDDCFAKNRSSKPDFNKSGFSKPEFGNKPASCNCNCKEDIKAVNVKLDKILEMLGGKSKSEKPSTENNKNTNTSEKVVLNKILAPKENKKEEKKKKVETKKPAVKKSSKK